MLIQTQIPHLDIQFCKAGLCNLSPTQSSKLFPIAPSPFNWQLKGASLPGLNFLIYEVRQRNQILRILSIFSSHLASQFYKDRFKCHHEAFPGKELIPSCNVQPGVENSWPFCLTCTMFLKIRKWYPKWWFSTFFKKSLKTCQSWSHIPGQKQLFVDGSLLPPAGGAGISRFLHFCGFLGKLV